MTAPVRPYTVPMAVAALAVAALGGVAAHLWTSPVSVPTPASVDVAPAATVLPPPAATGSTSPTTTGPGPGSGNAAQQAAPPTTVVAPSTTAAPVVVTPDHPVIQGDGSGDGPDGPDTGDR